MDFLILTAAILTWEICSNINFILVKACLWFLMFSKYSRFVRSLVHEGDFDLHLPCSCFVPIYVLFIWQSSYDHIWQSSYMNEHLSLAGEVQTLVEFASSAELLSHSTSSSFVYGHHEEGQILQTKDVWRCYIYSRAILFIWWHLFKHAHIRYKIHNSCWSSRYIMKYAFNLLTKAWMYMKVYDECICVYNWRGYLSQHCKPSKTKSKNSTVHMQSTSLVSHIIQFSTITPKCIYGLFALFENQKEPSLLSDKGKWWSGEKSDILEYLKTSSCDVSMKIGDAAAIVHIWPEPSKLQTLNNT